MLDEGIARAREMEFLEMNVRNRRRQWSILRGSISESHHLGQREGRVRRVFGRGGLGVDGERRGSLGRDSIRNFTVVAREAALVRANRRPSRGGDDISNKIDIKADFLSICSWPRAWRIAGCHAEMAWRSFSPRGVGAKMGDGISDGDGFVPHPGGGEDGPFHLRTRKGIDGAFSRFNIATRTLASGVFALLDVKDP